MIVDLMFYSLALIGTVAVTYFGAHFARGIWLAHNGYEHPPRGQSVWRKQRQSRHT
jgi:hypothetical protein